MRATLFQDPGEPKAGDAAPLTMHWCYMMAIVAASEIGPDGHPARGGFLPPVPLPRRMWAGGTTDFSDVLRVGDPVTRRSEITNVELKTGGTGALCFVTVHHVYSTPRGPAITETQNLVYRDPAPASAGAKAPPPPAPAPKAAHSKAMTADPVMLFRYSALTMNGHRIHYDLPYAMDVEAYPALVVHGPLQATLLADLAVKSLGKPLASFSFRGQVPAFAGTRLNVCGEPAEGGGSFWTEQSGGKNMVATATVS